MYMRLFARVLALVASASASTICSQTLEPSPPRHPLTGYGIAVGSGFLQQKGTSDGYPFATVAQACSAINTPVACTTDVNGYTEHYCQPAGNCGDPDRDRQMVVPVCSVRLAPYDMHGQRLLTFIDGLHALGGLQGANPIARLLPYRGSAGCVCRYSMSSPLEVDATPYLPTGQCYGALELRAKAATTLFSAALADEPVPLSIRVEGPYLRENVLIRLEISSTKGTPGTLSHMQGRTDADGRLTVDYRFPSNFTEAKVDTISVFCDSCSTASRRVDIPMRMAPVMVGFFNGVGNTQEQARDGLDELKKHTETVRGKVAVTYDLYYNQTNKPLRDVAEVFAQRSQELDGVMANRWEYFWELLTGRYTAPTSLTHSLLRGLNPGVLALAQAFDSTFQAMLGQIVSGWSQLLNNPPTAADVSNHISKLQAHVDKGSPLLLIAHSQGNLFVNTAHDAVRKSRPASVTQVVHIAPASPTLRGDHVLAGIDIVINGLRVQGVTSVPPANINLPFSKVDASGHKLVDTYLDASRASLERVKSMIKTALGKL